jgi:hypothetical protein
MGIAVRALGLAGFIFLILFDGTTAAQEQPQQLPPESPPLQETKSSDDNQEPKPELERPSVWGEPTEVRIHLYTIDLDQVDSANQNFAASVYYEARWNSPYLIHEGPGPLKRGVTEVWTPRIVIVNQQMAWFAFPGAVEIYPDGEVVYRQKVWGRFSQPLQLKNFPLDRQVLNIHVVAAGLLQEEVKLVDYESGIAPQFSIPDFEVTGWKVEPGPYPDMEDAKAVPGFIMEIEIKRYFGFFVMKTIVPLCLIVMMSWAPRWIDADQIGTNIGVSTTAFLTLVAYLFATNALLPPVSYITRMDRFIFLSTLIVFAGLAQTVVSTMLFRRGKTKLVEKVDRLSRVIHPLILLLVLIVSFVS